MKNARALDRVRDMARDRARALAQEVGAALKEKADAQSTLERLSGYASEYSGGRSASGGATVSAIENRHLFVSRLNAALEQQRSRAQTIDEQAERALSSWRRACADVEALDRLAQQRERAQVREEEKREQRDADAVALRAFQRPRAD